MRTSIALAVVAMTSSAFADAKHDKQMKTVLAAIKLGPDALRPLVKRFPLSIAGLPLSTKECTSVAQSNVELPELAAFAECMKSLRPVVEGGVFVVEPGFEIDAHFEDGKLVAFTTRGEVRASRTQKQLGATANIPPDAMSLAGVSKKTPFLAVDIALCVATDGSVDSASVERYNLVDAGTWADQLLAATKTAVYKPFTHRGTPVRVCTHQVHVHPAAKRRAGVAELDRLRREKEDENGVEGGVVGGAWDGVEGGTGGGYEGGVPGLPPPPPPPPPPSAQNVPPTLLEGQRIAGKKAIVPDDETKKKIAASGKDKIIGSFKLCVDTSGSVVSVSMLKATGFPAYDTLILREMRAWKYTPYQVNGKAVPVCTAATFIYSQK